MAYEVPVLDFTLTAAADLRTKQYHIMKVTANNAFNICSVDGENAVGILQDDPNSGEGGSIRMLGVSKVKVKASETLAAGDGFGTANDGTATKVDATSTGADLGDHQLGIVLEGATGPALATVLWRPIGRVTA